jgi:hypothetical protein
MGIAVRAWIACSVSGLALLAGCSGGGPKTHAVSGKVEVKDGEVAILTGSNVEMMLETDETLRSSGKIDSTGAYQVQTQHGGKILDGAPEGKYKVRIVLGDESDEGVPKRKGNPIHPRYLDFATSGLSFTVPASDYTVSLSKK